MERGDLDWARSIINNLPDMTHSFVSSELAARLALVKSHLAAAEGYTPLAYSHLNNPELLAKRNSLPPELARAITAQRAQQLFDMEHYPASAEERVLLSDLLIEDDDAQRLRRAPVVACHLHVGRLDVGLDAALLFGAFLLRTAVRHRTTYRLDEAGLESSGPWNNAGTGPAALGAQQLLEADGPRADGTGPRARPRRVAGRGR